MPVSRNELTTIAPRSGTAFSLRRGETLLVQDVEGEQVSDFVCFSLTDFAHSLSSGRTLDYAGKWLLTTGDILYSNRSHPMVRIMEDTVGRHDFLLTPCSKDTFRILYGHTHPHRGCQGNLESALGPYGVLPDQIPTTFNLFMHVQLEETGQLKVLPPLSRAGDHIVLRAEMDLLVGLTACSAEQSNNGSFKPIRFIIVGS